jgi:hypothetical protein
MGNVVIFAPVVHGYSIRQFYRRDSNKTPISQLQIKRMVDERAFSLHVRVATHLMAVERHRWHLYDRYIQDTMRVSSGLYAVVIVVVLSEAHTRRRGHTVSRTNSDARTGRL